MRFRLSEAFREARLRRPPPDPWRRAALLRAAAAALVWAALLGCLLASLRSAFLAQSAWARVEGGSLTPREAAEARLAEEAARAFAADWATFDSRDPADYARRMSRWLSSPPGPPRGVQRCLSASAASLERAGEGRWRAVVLLTVERAAPPAEGESPSPALLAGPPPGQGAAGEPGRAPSYWRRSALAVEVSVLTDGGRARPAGPPVLAPPPRPLAPGPDPQALAGGEAAPDDFKVFAQQALEFYLAGKDMANFLAPDAEIRPLGGWRLERAEVAAFGRRGDSATAVVRAEVSRPDLEGLPQAFVLEAVKRDRWLLTRLGAW